MQGTFPGPVLDELIPGLNSDTQGTVCIAVDSNRLVQGGFPLVDDDQAVVRL